MPAAVTPKCGIVPAAVTLHARWATCTRRRARTAGLTEFPSNSRKAGRGPPLPPPGKDVPALAVRNRRRLPSPSVCRRRCGMTPGRRRRLTNRHSAQVIPPLHYSLTHVRTGRPALVRRSSSSTECFAFNTPQAHLSLSSGSTSVQTGSSCTHEAGQVQTRRTVAVSAGCAVNNKTCSTGEV